jgi:hypothetical protein
MVIFSSGLLHSTLLLLNYGINKASITELFCINKEKPELKCDGKCHLGKQLKESKDTSSEQNSPPEHRNLSEFVVQPETATFFVYSEVSSIKFYSTPSTVIEGFGLIDIPPPRMS